MIHCGTHLTRLRIDKAQGAQAAQPVRSRLGASVHQLPSTDTATTEAGALILAAVASALPVLGAPPAIVLIAIITMAGVGLGAVLPPRDLMLKVLTPAGQTGKVFGFVFVGYSLGVSVSPLLLGAFLDAGMPALVFLGSAGFAALSLIAIYAAYVSSPKGT